MTSPHDMGRARIADAGQVGVARDLDRAERRQVRRQELHVQQREAARRQVRDEIHERDLRGVAHAVKHGLRPLRRLADGIGNRKATDLSPLGVDPPYAELRPLTSALERISGAFLADGLNSVAGLNSMPSTSSKG